MLSTFYSMSPVLTGGGSSTVGWSDLSSVLSAITDQISVSTVVAVVAGAIGAAIGLVFMWWGVRKLIRVLMGAFRKGRLSA